MANGPGLSNFAPVHYECREFSGLLHAVFAHLRRVWLSRGDHANFKRFNVELFKKPYASESTSMDPSGDRHVKQAKIGHRVTTQSVMAGLYQAEIVLATCADTTSKYV